MYSKIISGAPIGVEAYLVGVEVDISPGLPYFNIVGSIGNEVRESRERVSVAMKNVGLRMPTAKIVVNLSPADKRKDTTAFDLAIAIGIFKSMNELGKFNREEPENTLFLGELGLNGELRKVKGVLPIVGEAARKGIKSCIVPGANLMEAAVVPGIKVFGAENIMQVYEYLRSGNESLLESRSVDINNLFDNKNICCEYDFAGVYGQETAKRAVKIAAAGFHNLLMTGPPGAGKSMIAKCIPGILPPVNLSESLEITSIKSVAGLLEDGESLVTGRPFVSPHHTVTLSALIGGGTIPRPGAMTLAHRGVLFLDELPEFGRKILDSMRQPLEDKKINIARVHGNIVYPADCMLVAAMNPCPCGYYPDSNRCSCSSVRIKHYMEKISGPILDRIDLCVELKPVDVSKIRSQSDYKTEGSAEMRECVMAARKMQERRFEGTGYRFNGDISAQDVEKYCFLGKEERHCIDRIYESLMLSVRTYHRILKVARTIADLEQSEEIKSEHLLEAACYRPASDYWK